MKPLHKFAVMIGIAFGAAAPATAAVLVSEGFDYDVGALSGRNGGVGFSSGWVDRGAAGQTGGVWDPISRHPRPLNKVGPETA